MDRDVRVILVAGAFSEVSSEIRALVDLVASILICLRVKIYLRVEIRAAD